MPGLSKLCVCILSTTRRVSTVSAACLATTVPLTSRWTHLMSVSVSRAVFLSLGGPAVLAAVSPRHPPPAPSPQPEEARP